MALDNNSFEFLRDLLLKESGLVVTQEKIYLLESRLLPVASKRGIDSLKGLIDEIKLKRDTALIYEVVEAMTTNETSFFRDSTPFDRLKENVLPALAKSRSNKSLKIWCAACSSGQEPYSLVMMLKEHPEFSKWNIDITGTDLSEDILNQAREGLYTQFEVQRGLPIQMLVKYFTQEGDKWRIKDEIKKDVKLKKMNVLTDIPFMGSDYDVIFCRNVLIYFDTDNKSKVFAGLKKSIRQDGVLFLGGAETVIGITDQFKPVNGVKGIYVRDDTSFVPESA